MNTRVIPSLSVLRLLLGTDDAGAKLLRRSGRLLTHDMEGRFVPNVNILKSRGVPMERIIRLLHNNLWCLCLMREKFRKSVEKAEEMGADRSSKMFIYALQAVCSMTGENWELKLQAFWHWGFSEGDILKMFRKYPMVFSKSMEKLERTKDVLLATGKYGMPCIVNNPTSLTYSTEKRYKPRFQILEILEKKNLIEDWPTLSTIFPMSDQRFLKIFVDPYLSELDDAYAAERVMLGPTEKIGIRKVASITVSVNRSQVIRINAATVVMPDA